MQGHLRRLAKSTTLNAKMRSPQGGNENEHVFIALFDRALDVRRDRRERNGGGMRQPDHR